MRHLRVLLFLLGLFGQGCSSSRDFWSAPVPADLHDNWAQKTPGNEPAKTKD